MFEGGLRHVLLLCLWLVQLDLYLPACSDLSCCSLPPACTTSQVIHWGWAPQTSPAWNTGPGRPFQALAVDPTAAYGPTPVAEKARPALPAGAGAQPLPLRSTGLRRPARARQRGPA